MFTNNNTSLFEDVNTKKKIEEFSWCYLSYVLVVFKYLISRHSLINNNKEFKLKKKMR